MLVRFGFVAMAMSLTNASPSKTMTLSNFLKIFDRDAALRKITRIASDNLTNTLRILRHADASGVHVYRFSSKLIPLISHEITEDWDFFRYLQKDFEELGAFVRERNMRISFHPDHFTLLNTPRPEVLAASLRDLDLHTKYFELMDLDSHAKLVIHVGGGYADKPKSLQRFRDNWADVSARLRERITLENDDKTYTVADTLSLCETIQVPMVLDIHHHSCNHNPGDDLHEMLPRIFKTWSATELPPKIHVSSAKSEKEFRAHADYVQASDLVPFLDTCRDLDTDIDVMLEAKNKDEALFYMMRQLVKLPHVRFIDGGTIEYRP